MNKVILTGNLTKDAELRYVGDNKAMAMGVIAVNREWKDDDGNYLTDFINFVAWEHQARHLQNYGFKGSRVEIVGRWQVRTYESKDGRQVTVNECVVENIHVLPAFAKQAQPTPIKTINMPDIGVNDSLDSVEFLFPDADDDLPF